MAHKSFRSAPESEVHYSNFLKILKKFFHVLHAKNLIPTDPGNVNISNVEPYDKSASVSWIVESREACSGAVVNYTIFYYTQKGPLLSEYTTYLFAN